MRKLYDYHISKPIRFKNYWIFKPVRENCNRLFTFQKKKKNVSLIYLNLSLKFSGFNSKNVFYFDIFCSIPGMYLKGIRLQYLLKLCAKHFVKNFRDLLFYSSGLLSLIGFNSFKWSQICSMGAFPSCYKDWLKNPWSKIKRSWDSSTCTLGPKFTYWSGIWNFYRDIFRTFYVSLHIDPSAFLAHFWTICCNLPAPLAIWNSS